VDRDGLSDLAESRGRRPLPPLPRACLVVVDLQRFFTDPEGPRWLPDWPDRMPGVRALIEGFRRRSLPVIATRHGHPPGDPGGTMRFFFDRLPKGTHVFEYPLKANNAGNFSNGITTVQCMYAPEFSAHSEGLRVAVK